MKSISARKLLTVYYWIQFIFFKSISQTVLENTAKIMPDRNGLIKTQNTK
jgi:hypothetical protein